VEGQAKAHWDASQQFGVCVYLYVCV
jgi:hypothetical protein